MLKSLFKAKQPESQSDRQWREVQNSTEKALWESKRHGVKPILDDYYVPRPYVPGGFIKRSSIYVPFDKAQEDQSTNSLEQRAKRLFGLLINPDDNSEIAESIARTNAVGLRHEGDLPLRTAKIDHVRFFLADYHRHPRIPVVGQSIRDEAFQYNLDSVWMTRDRFEDLGPNQQKTVVDLARFVLHGAETVQVYKIPDPNW